MGCYSYISHLLPFLADIMGETLAGVPLTLQSLNKTSFVTAGTIRSSTSSIRATCLRNYRA
ncbi:MAG: hypothetical protein ABL869_08520 [Candidatus Nitrotoga sp.]